MREIKMSAKMITIGELRLECRDCIFYSLWWCMMQSVLMLLSFEGTISWKKINKDSCNFAVTLRSILNPSDCWNIHLVKPYFVGFSFVLYRTILKPTFVDESIFNHTQGMLLFVLPTNFWNLILIVTSYYPKYAEKKPKYLTTSVNHH